MMIKPDVKPENNNFSSGPCSKRPGWNSSVLNKAILGRSHRSIKAKSRINYLIKNIIEILSIPNDYYVGIVPGSDTGAVEIALWNLIGIQPVQMLVWDSFGNDWAKDLKEQLKVNGLNILKADYGFIPNFDNINFNDDIIFNFNGTTGGVRVPNLDWIPQNRNGLTICDGTSAAFAMEMDWCKLDVLTFSWQKCLGGEGGHGILILSPNAVERINTYNPSWPVPKLFNLKKNNKINSSIFEGSTINTPSLLCIEDFIDALEWAKKIGGLQGLIEISNNNLKLIKGWVKTTEWVDFLAQDEITISNTSICLRFSDKILNELDVQNQMLLEKNIVKILENENVAYDIGSYRSAPPGLRIWGGPTINPKDINLLLPWLQWAFEDAYKLVKKGN
ncbi:MAG: phosphoserine transaminase [Alphaproteobacteria bacterium]|nr:MAG: phosphoserine transaminase [Alphaproteobacteria bacterium]